MKATIIKLNEATRELLAKMNFPEIPTDAKYIAFTEDGEATFMEDLEFPVGFTMPRFAMMSYYEVEHLEMH